MADEAVETQDDAEVVDEQYNFDERDTDLDEKVGEILGEKPKKQTPSGGDDSDTPAEGTEEDQPVELSQATRDRATAAGITDSLAEHLSQTGLLEETLAAFDRQLIENTRSQDKPPERPAEPTPPQDRRGGREEPPPPLSADSFDDELVKRDTYYQSRISDLEGQLSRLSNLADNFERIRDDKFQEWFSQEVVGLENKELFGNGYVSKDSTQHKNQQTLCDNYERLCMASGVDPFGCHKEILDRAYPATFPKEVFKAAQRETFKRLKDAQGKFMSPTRPSGEPPKGKKLTPEQLDDKTVGDVQAILDKQY